MFTTYIIYYHINTVQNNFFFGLDPRTSGKWQSLQYRSPNTTTTKQQTNAPHTPHHSIYPPMLICLLTAVDNNTIKHTPYSTPEKCNLLLLLYKFVFFGLDFREPSLSLFYHTEHEWQNNARKTPSTLIRDTYHNAQQQNPKT